MEVNTTTVWHGDRIEAAIKRVIGNRLDAAAIHLQNRVKQNLSKPGTAKFQPGMTRTSNVYMGQMILGTRQSAITGRYVQRRVHMGIMTLGSRREFTRHRRGARIYGAKRSRVGDFPLKQTGMLRGSITHETDRDTLTARVGTNLGYGKVLELGLPPMKGPRPFMRMTLTAEMANLQSIVQQGHATTESILSGGLYS